MLDRNDLIKMGPPGFHLAQLEKDYIQYLILSYISRSGFGGIFKGGTALQKAYSLPRYSEDLDFNLNKAKEINIDSLISFLESYGFSGLSYKKIDRDISTKIILKYYGPLYNGNEISAGHITFDISKREEVDLPPEIVTINPPYSDLLPYQLKIMNRKEMIAEKIRAIMTRESARDLYDLFFLLKSNSVDFKLVNKKLEYYKKIYNFEEFKKHVKKLEKIWKKEISALTTNYIEYDLVATYVINKVKNN